MKKWLFLCGLALVINPYANNCFAQSDSAIMRNHMHNLTKPLMKGRGYVGGGMERAAQYIADEMAYYHLIPMGNNGYFHDFEMPVNTFPSKMSFFLDYDKLEPGIDYLVDPFSSSAAYDNKHILHVDMPSLFENVPPDEFTSVWHKYYVDHGKNEYYVYALHNIEAFKEMWGNKALRAMSQFLIEGEYIIPTKGTPLWYPAMNQEKFNIIYVFGDAIRKVQNAKMASSTVDAVYHKQFKASNIAGYIPALQKTDQFLVFTAHYDHIGMMGAKTRFDGASDNASGTAAMLTLMNHYAHYPLENYNILFVACAAEEAGLIGSFRYAESNLVNLSKIKFLINLDIWGDATDGLAVVNGKVYEKEYQYLVDANKALADYGNGYFKEITQGGEATNSDHAPFYLKGVPSIFIFTKGGLGYYHHVNDKANTLQLTNINQALKLIKLFVNRF